MKSMLRIAAAFALASSMSSVAVAGTMLAVPARHDLVDLAFDLQDLLARDLTIACFKGEDAIESIEVFDRARGEWLPVSPERWASPYFPGCDKAVIVGMSKAASDLLARSIWAKRSVQPTDRAYLDIVLAVNACEPLSPAQWKSLSKKHGFQIKEMKAPSRFERQARWRKAREAELAAESARANEPVAQPQGDKELPAPFAGKSAFDDMPSATEEANRIAQAEEASKVTESAEARKAEELKIAEEEAARKAIEEAAAKKAAEEEAAKKAAELKAAEEAAAKKAAEEEAARKAAEEAAAKKAAEEAAAKKAAEEEAARKAAELKAAEEAVKITPAEEAAMEAAKKAAEETAKTIAGAVPSKKAAEPAVTAATESNVPLAVPVAVPPAPVAPAVGPAAIEPPEIKVPAVKLNDIPEANPAAGVTLPEVKAPEIKVPEIKVPEVKGPEAADKAK